MDRAFNTTYEGARLNHIAFPVGGMGAGMFCLQGTGALGNFSIRNAPALNMDPNMFAAIHLKDPDVTRVLETQVPPHKVFLGTGGVARNHGQGRGDYLYGLPRFEGGSFTARFPFATLKLEDDLPFDASVTAWSPFEPNNAETASLPFGCLEYSFTNTGSAAQELVFSFNAFQAHGLIKLNDKVVVRRLPNGFAFVQPGSEDTPWEEGELHVWTDEPATVDAAWYRGGWWDAGTVLWNRVNSGYCEGGEYDDPTRSPGASVIIPFELIPGESRTIRLYITWYVPKTKLRFGWPKDEKGQRGETHVPWYAGRFASIRELDDYVRENADKMREEALRFSDCLYASTVPPEIIEAVAANLTILKSPTVLRQTDGRVWGWEGCNEECGCCEGICTHVWNYAQALCNLFPELERGLRQTEFFDSQDAEGYQRFRATLPIGRGGYHHYAASDGQLGGIIKVYREWMISGDIEWLKRFWPAVKQSLAYCMKTWDPSGQGVLLEMHHNTYDIEFWGAEPMCSSFYLGALVAANRMAAALGDKDAGVYDDLYQKGKAYLENRLYNGEYFYQRVAVSGLERNPKPADNSVETVEIFNLEGPKYQYGTGCISDGVIGAWLARLSGLGDILDIDKVKSHLRSLYKYNFKRDLSGHANPQRPAYALGHEGGLLLCSWPRGGKPTFPFVYSDEVWTGIEYEVASYMIMLGMVEEGLELVRACRGRYDGLVRNPFNEYECGNWYARAMSSYALLAAYSGVRYDREAGILTVEPKPSGDFQCFFCTDGGYGLVGVRNGKPFFEPVKGWVPVREVRVGSLTDVSVDKFG